jgi:predicted lysophospholipase L1 biosynthesis ABC-type transport system permease subunit
VLSNTQTASTQRQEARAGRHARKSSSSASGDQQSIDKREAAFGNFPLHRGARLETQPNQSEFKLKELDVKRGEEKLN